MPRIEVPAYYKKAHTTKIEKTVMNIEAGKTYITRNGLKVRILCTDAKVVTLGQRYPIVALRESSLKENEETYHYCMDNGKVYANSEDLHDLVREVSPWDDFKIDDPVMAKVVGGQWLPGYFAGLNQQGKPTVFPGGVTRWTASVYCNWEPWVADCCRRPTTEELAGDVQ